MWALLLNIATVAAYVTAEHGGNSGLVSVVWMEALSLLKMLCKKKRKKGFPS